MPGLFGVVRLDPQRRLAQEFLEALLERMAARLRHYEGYVTETFVDPDATFAIGRIGYPHLNSTVWENRDRPRRHEGRSFYAGTIHFGVPAADYAGADGLQHYWRRISGLSGSFAAVVQSSASGETIIMVDRHASQPVYYATHDGLLIFAPEVKALLEIEDIDTCFDSGALATFLSSGYLLSAQSFFARIRRLPGGTALMLGNGAVKVTHYWRFSPGKEEIDKPIEEYAREVGQCIDTAVTHDLDDPAKTVLLLSGGVDSRAILGAAYHALQRHGSRLHAVTWGCDPGRAGADIQIAGQLARALNLEHQVIETNLAEYAGYAQVFRRVNYLLDGMSESCAIHPDKFKIMENLYEAGFRRVLRGEQTFGFAKREYSIEGAMAKLGLHRFKDAGIFAQIINPDSYPAMADASDELMDQMVREGAALDPNDFTHHYYFNDRYQSLGGKAAYYKQVLMDHRTPLLDNAILDIIQHLPKRLRVEKALLYYSVKQRYPELAKIDYAAKTNLEDWGKLIFTDTPVRRYFLEELSDSASGIWDYLNRASLLSLMQQIHAPSSPRRENHGSARLRMTLKRFAYRVAPRYMAHNRLAKFRKQGVAPYNVLLRAVILKNWYDTFVQGR